MPDSPAVAPGLLESRLALIELRLRRLRILSGLLLLLAGAAAWAAISGPGESLIVSRLILEDEAGRQRGVISATGGAPALAFYDSTGQLRGDVGLTQDGRPAMILLDASGRPIYSLTERASGGLTVLLSTPGTGSRVMLRSGTGQETELSLTGSDSAMVSLRPGPVPTLTLQDARGKAPLVLRP